MSIRQRFSARARDQLERGLGGLMDDGRFGQFTRLDRDIGRLAQLVGACQRFIVQAGALFEVHAVLLWWLVLALYGLIDRSETAGFANRICKKCKIGG